MGRRISGVRETKRRAIYHPDTPAGAEGSEQEKKKDTPRSSILKATYLNDIRDERKATAGLSLIDHFARRSVRTGLHYLVN